MRFWKWLTRRREDHGWPGYIINGRIRTSTAGLIIAFFAISWLHNAYQPPPPTPSAPETAVVPPGFVPDPQYTWVPRTKVNTPTETTPTTTQTPTETSAPDTTETLPTTTGPTTAAPTTVVDPDGPGPAPATTVTPGTSAPTVTTVLPAAPTTTNSAGVPGTNPTPMPTQPGGR